MRLGWLADPPLSVVAGAELSTAALRASAPSGIEIIECPPGGVVDADAYVVHNRTLYEPRDMARLNSRPFVVAIKDMWTVGSSLVRQWLLDHATLCLFYGPPHGGAFPWQVNAPVEYIPAPVDPAPFESISYSQRKGIFWLGAMHEPHKGVQAAMDWANETRTPIDFYGAGTFCPAETEFVRWHGYINHAQVPTIMAQYETFLYMPQAVEPYGRTITESHFAGCELDVRGESGALWWLDHRPDDMRRGAELFWCATMGALL